MDVLAILGWDTSLYHLQDGATELSLCNPDREFGICISVNTQFSAKLLNRNCYRLSRVL